MLLFNSHSRLLAHGFVVAPARAFAQHPARRGPECPPVSGDRHVIAAHRRRQTPRAAIGRLEHAALRRERAAGSRQAIGVEVYGPGTCTDHGTRRIREASASARHHEHRAVNESLTSPGDPCLPLLLALFFWPRRR